MIKVHYALKEIFNNTSIKIAIDNKSLDCFSDNINKLRNMILLASIVFASIICFGFNVAIIIYSKKFKTINVIFFALFIIDIVFGLSFVLVLVSNIFGEDKFLFLGLIGILWLSSILTTIVIGIIICIQKKEEKVQNGKNNVTTNGEETDTFLNKNPDELDSVGSE